MGCGCQGSKATSTWVYVSRDGNQYTFKSQLEARAKQIRDGGGGTITAVSR